MLRLQPLWPRLRLLLVSLGTARGRWCTCAWGTRLVARCEALRSPLFWWGTSRLPQLNQLTAGACPNVPLLVHNGVLFHCPNVRNLMDDVTAGFSYVWTSSTKRMVVIPNVGFLHDHCLGPSSSPRTSSTSRTLSARDTHSHSLQGVLKERDEGKISGPLAAPTHWNVSTVHFPPHLRTFPPWDRPQAATAVAFATVTEGSQVFRFPHAHRSLISLATMLTISTE